MGPDWKLSCGYNARPYILQIYIHNKYQTMNHESWKPCVKIYERESMTYVECRAVIEPYQWFVV